MSFIFYNPNPSGKRTGDCVIRAIRMSNRGSGYSRHDGKEDMIANLHDMLNDAISTKEKDAIHQCIEKLQNM